MKRETGCEISILFNVFCIAFQIIVSVIGLLRKRIKMRMESEEKDVEEPKKKIRKTKKAMLRDITNTDRSSNCQEDEEQVESPSVQNESRVSDSASLDAEKPEDILDAQDLVGSLFNSVSVLWAVFLKQFQANPKLLNDLYTLSISLLPQILKFYRGTRLYYQIVSFASHIPVNQISSVSTLTSACISEMKEMEENSDQEEIKTLVFALCSWNRGADVLELATDWLNYAFKQLDLNRTTLDCKTSKVRFKGTIGKPLVAIQFVNTIIGSYIHLNIVLEKSYDELLDFFVYISRIKTVIEKRMEHGQQLAENELNDEFIVQCFTLYVSLIDSLHRPDELNCSKTLTDSIHSAEVSLEIINWASNVIVPKILFDEEMDSRSECSLEIRLVNAVIRNANFIIEVNHTNKEHALTTSLFVFKLLSSASSCSPYLLESSFNTIRVLGKHAVAYTRDDEWGLMTNVLPNSLKLCLTQLACSNLTSANLPSYVSEVHEFRKAIFSYINILSENYGDSHEYYLTVYDLYVETMITAVSREVMKMDNVEIYTKIEDHPTAVASILKYLLNGVSRRKLLIKSLDNYISIFKEDGVKLLSCISILGTITYKNKLLQQIEVENCIANALECIHNYKAPSLNDSFFAEHSINVKERGEEMLLELSRFNGCALSKFKITKN